MRIPSVPRRPSSVSTTTPSGGGFAARLEALAARLDRGERAVDAAVARLGRAAPADGGLLALQAAVYRHAGDVHLASKVVDAAVDGVKRIVDAQR